MQLDSRQREQAIALLEEIPWGDMDASIRDLEEALGRALDATAGERLLWEVLGEDPDDSSLSVEDIAEMSLDYTLAYVARAVRSLALVYGVSIGDFDDPPMLVAKPGSPGGVLRALNDLVGLPVTDGSPSAPPKTHRNREEDA